VDWVHLDRLRAVKIYPRNPDRAGDCLEEIHRDVIDLVSAHGAQTDDQSLVLLRVLA